MKQPYQLQRIGRDAWRVFVRGRFQGEIILCGGGYRAIPEDAPNRSFPTKQDAAAYLAGQEVTA